MEIIINGSSSKGNNYILVEGNSALMLEAGVKFKTIAGSGVDLGSIKGLLVTHEHGDHIKYVNDILASSGFDLYATPGTIQAGIDKGFLSESGVYRYKEINPKQQTDIGGWDVLPFSTVHDHPTSPIKDPVGFLIKSPLGERAVFITDTLYCPVKLPKGINYWLVECNHDVELVQQSRLPRVVKDRIIKTHTNIETCKQFFESNDMSGTKRIILLHLSAENSDAPRFKKEIEEVTGKLVEIAEEENHDRKNSNLCNGFNRRVPFG